MRRGTRVGQAYVAITADGDGMNEDIVDEVEKAGPGVEKAGRDHGERYGEGFSDGFDDESKGRMRRILDKISGGARERFGKSGDDSGKDFSDRFEGHFDESFFRRIGAHVGGHLVDALNFALSREGGDNPLADLVDRWMDDAVSGNGSSGGRGRKKRNIGDLIGGAFGAGSRNNFLNIFGKTLGNIVNLTEGAAKGAGKMFSVFAKGFSSAEEGASFLQKTMSGFSEIGASGGSGFAKIMETIASSGPAAVVAILAVVAALSIMVSIVSALTALITAMVATITSALTGAVIVAAGAFAALAAAGGLVAVAFTSMTDAQKKMLTDAFAPLKQELVGIGQIMLQDMVPAFHTWSANLQAALMQAVPVAQVAGRAFANAGSILTASFSGPGFQMFSQMLAVYLPGIITKLSSALGQFLNGMAGLFAALLPYVDRFAGYLNRVATQFAAWATSAQGQNSIRDFVDRALVSLQSLWNAVSAIGGFISQVLFSPEAQNAGNSIFDSIAKTFRKMTDGIKRAQADGSLKKWFADAIKFGGRLWNAIEALYEIFTDLYNSGVLSAIGLAIEAWAWQMKIALKPVEWLVKGIGWVGDGLDWLNGKFRQSSAVTGDWLNGLQSTVAAAAGIVSHYLSQNAGAGSANAISMPSLQQSGLNALNATSVSNGGYKPDPVKQPKQYHNPYKAWANSLIKDGPSTSATIKNAMLALNKAFATGIRSAATDTGGEEAVRSTLSGLYDNLTATSASVVNTARDALNSAASSLAGATSKSAAANALRKVRKAQKDLRAAIKDQQVINRIAKGIKWQQTVDWKQVDNMVKGLGWTNASLATLAAARSRVAAKLATANQQLTDALALRNDYNKQVTDSIRAYAGIATAQAQTIDGVEQALTAGDITSNLQARLDKIKHFQDDLQLLLAQGLSNDAYKQIVDEGVDGGSTLADALLAGGSAAIQQTNGLVDQINGIATQLGTETSNRLYQAGVSAAQGLVDGLTSLSAQLDSAAAKLGATIANAVKKELGIKSPSKVMDALMDPVGDGAVNGLNRQHIKVGSAASALASLIAVNPGNGRPPAGGPDDVSGNLGPKVLWTGDIVTPTEDPHAVANEALNELVGRL